MKGNDMRNELHETAALLARARRDRRRVTLQQSARPADLAEAYALQDAIGRDLVQDGAAPSGWKVGAPHASAVPTAAPIYSVLRSPARIHASHLTMIGIEAEIAFAFGAGLPARAAPYSDAEVFAAVRALCVAIEVCDSRLEDWQAADDLTKLADHSLNYALVIGDERTDFRTVDFGAQAVRTLADGRILKEGVGCHALVDPRVLLPWLANHAAGRGGLKAGAVVTTGSWLGMHFVAPGASVEVQFPGIGEATVAFPTEG